MKEFVDKLISRLKEEQKLADEVKEKCARENPLMFDNAKGYSTGIANAKHIVNELAEEYNNEVCEWTEYDYKTIRSPHERDWSIPSMKDFKYCPYCRKKIKVVK